MNLFLINFIAFFQIGTRIRKSRKSNKYSNYSLFMMFNNGILMTLS